MKCMFCSQGEELKKALYNGKEVYTHIECAEVNDDYQLTFVDEANSCMFCSQREELKKALYNGKEVYTHIECAEMNDDYQLTFVAQ